MKRPICSHCAISQRQCGGPGSPFVLHRSTLEAQPKIPFKASTVAAVRHVYITGAGRGQQQQKRTESISSGLVAQGSAAPAPMLTADAAHSLRTRLLQCLNYQTPGYRVQTFAPFFPFLDNHIGNSRALDAAIECILAAHNELVNPGSAGDRTSEMLELFQEAFTALVDEVASTGDQAPSTDAVAAAIMLATCEIYSKEHRGSIWTSHVAGISAMLREWNPNELQSEFELGLIAAYAPISIAKCLTTKKRCFLSSSDWSNALLRSSIGESTRLSIQVDSILASLPELYQGLSLGVSGESISNGPNMIPSSRAWNLLRRLETHRPAEPAPLTSSTQPKPLSRLSMNSTCEFSYTFSDPPTARGFAMYWTALLIVINLLHHLGVNTPELDVDADVAIDSICRSIEYAHTQRPLGCIYMSWCLPVAYVSVKYDDRMREWLLDAYNLIFAPLNYQYSSLHFRSVGETLTSGLVS